MLIEKPAGTRQAIRPDNGFTLIELMVSMTIGLIVVGAVIALMVNTLNTSSRNILGSQVAQQLRATMEILSRDLRRAGAMPNVIDCYAQNACDNVFTDVTYFDYSIGGSNNCVIFSLDRNLDGDGDDADDNAEWVGFRHDVPSGIIEMKISGDADDADCIDGMWVTLTDTDIINVTAFNLDTTPSYTSLVTQDTAANTQTLLEVRKVDISITGELASGGYAKTITETIRLRNDRFFTQLITP